MSIYTMAHRVNNYSRLNTALEWGANGIEFDVTNRWKSGLEVFHGGALDTANTNFEAFITSLGIRCRGTAGENVCLLICDLKYGARAGISCAVMNQIRQSIADNILSFVSPENRPADNAGFYVYYTLTNTPEHLEIVEDALADVPLTAFEGINFDASLGAFGLHKSLATIDDALRWRDANPSVENMLYSAGVTTTWAGFNRGSANRDVLEKHLRDGSARRASDGVGTYSWTYNRARSARRDLNEFGLTGVMGNMGRNFGNLPLDLAGYGVDDARLVRRDSPRPF